MDRENHPVVRQYAKLAGQYESRWSHYVQATTRETLNRLPAQPGAVLDVGCGTGALLSCLVDEFPEAELTGGDASPEMLAVAQARLPASVTLCECWAESLPFADATFDTVISCNMFHFIRHPEIALGEMLRVLRPDGTLVITDWCDDYLTCWLCDFYLRWVDPSHFRMYGVSQCAELLRNARTRQIRIEKYRISWLWGLMTATAQKPADVNTSRAQSRTHA